MVESPAAWNILAAFPSHPLLSSPDPAYSLCWGSSPGRALSPRLYRGVLCSPSTSVVISRHVYLIFSFFPWAMNYLLPSALWLVGPGGEGSAAQIGLSLLLQT